MSQITMEEFLAFYFILNLYSISISLFLCLILFTPQHLKTHIVTYTLKFLVSFMSVNILLILNFLENILNNDQFTMNSLLCMSMIFAATITYGIYYIRPA